MRHFIANGDVGRTRSPRSTNLDYMNRRRRAGIKLLEYIPRFLALCGNELCNATIIGASGLVLDRVGMLTFEKSLFQPADTDCAFRCTFSDWKRSNRDPSLMRDR